MYEPANYHNYSYLKIVVINTIRLIACYQQVTKGLYRGINSYSMIRLFGLLSFLLALFLVPLNVRLLTDATNVNSAGSGVWIIFVMMVLLTVSSGWMGWKFIRRA